MNKSTSFQPVGGVVLSGKLPRRFPPFLTVWGGQTEREAAFLNAKLHARTSQSCYVYRYLPEEGQEGDWEKLHSFLLDFLRYYKKKKRTKWKYVQKALASDDMRFQNGMICHD